METISARVARNHQLSLVVGRWQGMGHEDNGFGVKNHLVRSLFSKVTKVGVTCRNKGIWDNDQLSISLIALRQTQAF